jgi:hypothetical protein
LNQDKDQSLFWKLGFVQGVLSLLAHYAEDCTAESIRESALKGEALLQEVIDELLAEQKLALRPKESIL